MKLRTLYKSSNKRIYALITKALTYVYYEGFSSKEEAQYVLTTQYLKQEEHRLVPTIVLETELAPLLECKWLKIE